MVKELSVAAKNVQDSFRFRIPYIMTSHGSDENGLNWEDGHIAYHDLYTVMSWAVAGSLTSTEWQHEIHISHRTTGSPDS